MGQRGPEYTVELVYICDIFWQGLRFIYTGYIIRDYEFWFGTDLTRRIGRVPALGHFFW